jgi:flavin reductase (DIM6/NTAB) family NADH-FMN oxidoreductase RutF
VDDHAEKRFQNLVALLDYPLAIVTTVAGGERAGCLVGFLTQCCINPPRYLVCLSKKNRTFRVAAGGAQFLAVHFPAQEDERLARLFGSETGDDIDKFAHCAWEEGPHGIPLLTSCPNRFVGRVSDRVDFGDHEGFVLEPSAAASSEGFIQFGFQRGKTMEPGHPP